MATITIPWNTGGGNITLTYRGQGNASVQVSSDTYAGTTDRSQTVTLTTTSGSPAASKSVVILQRAKVVPSFSWSSTWTSSANASAVNGLQYTSPTPKNNGSTVVRCTFRNVTSITFTFRFQGEQANDYLTVGALDKTCSRNSYGTSYQNKGSTWHTLTFTPLDNGAHFVEFCYSKNNKTDVSPDNAEVYVSGIE